MTPSTAAPPEPAAPMLELSGRVAELRAANRSVSRRNRVLVVAFGAGLVLMAAALAALYQWQVRSYAVLNDLRVEQDPTSPGRVTISFEVTSPGKVVYRRNGGGIEAEVTDTFPAPGRVTRQWAWGYEPGQPIVVSVESRSGVWTETRLESFPTSRHADVVVLMDTTGTMARSIETLKAKCGPFADRLAAQGVACRFALIGFGDAGESEWLDVHPFTPDVDRFRQSVAAVRRFDGGDFPESSLDAIEAALKLPLAEGSLRRLYLVTDDTYHEPSRSGAKVADLAGHFAKAKCHLTVFTVPEFAPAYERLRAAAPGTVTVLPMERFGAVLAEGRILDDQ